MAPLVRTGGSRHTGLAAPPHRNIQLRKDILIKMGKYYTEKTSGRTSLNMVTNGFLITEEVADELKEAGFRTVQVSLDGASAESHEWIRNQPGSFERAKEALRILVDRGFYVGVACTPSKKNLNEIDEIIEIVEEIGVNEFRMQPLMRMGRAKGMSEFFLDDKEYSCSVYKTYTNIPNGTYKFSIWAKTNGKQDVLQLYAKNYGGSELDTTIETSDINWNIFSIDKIVVTNHTLEIGVYYVE